MTFDLDIHTFLTQGFELTKNDPFDWSRRFHLSVHYMPFYCSTMNTSGSVVSLYYIIVMLRKKRREFVHRVATHNNYFSYRVIIE